MKIENKTALTGFIGGIVMTMGAQFLRPAPEVVENHIAPDTVFVAEPRTEDSLKLIEITTLLNEKDSILETTKPRIIYRTQKATPADSAVDNAANIVLSSITEADSL